MTEHEACKALLREKVKAKRVLAACVRENELVIITGTNDQWFYESALDMVTILTLAKSAQAGEMIPEYLT